MRNNLRNYGIALLGLLILGLSSLAWTKNQSGNGFQLAGDTLPKPKSAPKKDFDKQLQDLDKAMKQLENAPDIDFNKLQKDLDESMKNLDEQMAKQKVDIEKMQKQLQESIGKIDAEKIQSDLKASLSQLQKLDVQKLQDELKSSLANIDSEKMRAQIDASLKNLDKIDLEKMEKELEKSIGEVTAKVNVEDINNKVHESLKNIDFDKVKEEMNRAKKEMENNKGSIKIDLNNAKKDLEKAKQEIKGYQEMVYKMQDDGLLTTKKDYRIEYKDGKLSINGVVQPKTITDKYKKYFPKDGVTIKKENGELNINIQ